ACRSSERVRRPRRPGRPSPDHLRALTLPPLKWYQFATFWENPIPRHTTPHAPQTQGNRNRRTARCTFKEELRMAANGMDRRGFLLVSAGAAAVASTGIEGIVAAGRAPAFAQGTKLHWGRWVDFIPESDVELKRQMP